MKKKIVLILILCIAATMLCSCSSISYDEAKISNTYVFSDEYFTVIKEWDGGIGFPLEQIVYANDTKVMYYVFRGNHTGGITPLYNADGTLQIYEGE